MFKFFKKQSFLLSSNTFDMFSSCKCTHKKKSNPFLLSYFYIMHSLEILLHKSMSKQQKNIMYFNTQFCDLKYVIFFFYIYFIIQLQVSQILVPKIVIIRYFKLMLIYKDCYSFYSDFPVS